MILGNVAALSEPAMTGIVPPRVAEAEIVRSLAVIRRGPFCTRGEFCPMLLKAGQHSEIALIQYRAAIPLDIAGARALLLLGSTVLRHGSTGTTRGGTIPVIAGSLSAATFPRIIRISCTRLPECHP